jgi:hypothetical protein
MRFSRWAPKTRDVRKKKYATTPDAAIPVKNANKSSVNRTPQLLNPESRLGRKMSPAIFDDISV